MRIISDAMLDVYGSEKHIDVDRETLSYVVRKLLNFATYTFQIVALTKYGEGVHSSVRVASKFIDNFLKYKIYFYEFLFMKMGTTLTFFVLSRC